MLALSLTRSRLLLAALLAMVALAVVPAGASAVTKVNDLYLDDLDLTTNPTNYIFTAGDTIKAMGQVDNNASYRWFLINASGGVEDQTACLTAAGTAVEDTYTIQSDDPLSDNFGWTYKLRQYTSNTCATVASEGELFFAVARVNVYGDPGLTNPTNVFPTGGAIYVTLDGVNNLKGQISTSSAHDWTLTWIRPNGTVACENSNGSERADANAVGHLPDPTDSGAMGEPFLKFPPHTTATGALWNRESNYDGGGPCGTFTDLGNWKLRIAYTFGNDAEHYVVLNFTITNCSPATVTTDPAANVVTTYGNGNVSFTAAASGVLAPTVQWQVSTDGGGPFGNWANIPGATSNTLTINQPAVALNGNRYRAVYTNQCSGTQTDTSAEGLLTVNPKPLVGAFTANNKVYDGNTSATIATRSITTALIGTDVVTLNGGTATFNNKNVGNGKAVSGSGFTLGGANAANYTLSSVTNTTANITPLAVTGDFTAPNKVYDGNTSSAVTARTLAGDIPADDVDLVGGTATFGNKNVGNGKTVTLAGATLGGADAGNYTLTSVDTDLSDITPLAITGDFTAPNKVYDGNTSSAVTARTLVGDVPADDVDLVGGTATFGNKNVGNGKTVTLAGATLGGADAGNYTLSSVDTDLSDITPLAVTGDFTAPNKVYDGNTSSAVTARTLAGDIPADDVDLVGGTATFGTKNVGNGKTVTLAGATLGGADAGNYTLTSVDTAVADITPLAITGDFTAPNKVYDGNTSSAVTARTLAGDIPADDVDLVGGTATFGNKNVGNGKTVTLAGATLGGADAGNYTLSSVDTDLSDITPLAITGDFTAPNKVYDGNTSSAVTTRTLIGDVPADDVDLVGGTATFGTKNVGNGKTVTLAGATLGGADAGNYTLTSVDTAVADITPLAITGDFTAPNKVYDGNTSSAVTTRTLIGDVPADDVDLTGGTATFGTKSVATGKTVTLAGATLGGADAGNYTLTSVDTAVADITPLAITGDFTAPNKVYDGNTSSAVTTRTLIGDVPADDVELTGGTATFGTKNVANGKTVTLAGATLGGADAGNYTLTSVDTAVADITPLGITGDFTAPNKVYDGNTSSAVTTRTLIGDVPADDVDLVGGTATFGNKNVGNGKTVTLAGATLGGADAGNYTLTSVDTAVADITPLAITGDFTAPNKVYDANTSSAVTTRTLAGDIPADDVDLVGGTATFGTKNVGNGKTVTLAGATLGGADAGNYTLTSVDTALADITPLGVTGDFLADNKVYDGNTSATVTIGSRDVIGEVLGDDVQLTGGTATFGTKNVANGKTVTLAGATLGGADAGNYTLTSVDTALANITPLAITGDFLAENKVYDGNTSATVTTGSRDVIGEVLGDDVQLTGGTATFGTKNVANGKTVTLAGATLTGADAGNYTLTSVDTALANITPLAITGDFTAPNKVYDGNTSSTVTTRTLIGDVPADDVDLVGGTATFGTKNVANGKTVTLTGATLGGADAGNYTLTSVDTDLSDITPLAITGDFTGPNKVYDGNTSSTVTTRTLIGDVPADDVDLVGGTATFGTKNVANGKTVTLTGATLGGADAGNYTLTSVDTDLSDITPLAITGDFTAPNKVYDGNTSSAVTTRTLVGDVPADDVDLVGGTATFGTKNVANGKTVTLTGATLGGADAGNYTLSSVDTDLSDITPLAITGDFTAPNKVYDGNTASTVTTRTLIGDVPADDVDLVGGTATFGTKNVANGKTVTLAGATLGGADAGNYTLSSVDTDLSDITPLAITGDFTAPNKVYDGNTSSTVTTRTLTGDVPADDVDLVGGTATFANENVGTNKVVTLAGATLGGADAGNYTLSSVDTDLSDITPPGVTGDFLADNKVYDGNTSATVTTGSRDVIGELAGDDVQLTGGTATFGDENVGNGKTVTLAGATLTGADAGNYTLSSVDTALADITPLGVTGDFLADNKVYDGNTSATVTTGSRDVIGELAGDDVSLTGGTATFGTKNVGNGKTVTLAGATLGGADAGNYTLTSVDTALANITPLAITGDFTAPNKVYDGNTSSTVTTRTLIGDVPADDVDLVGGTATFGTKNVANGKTVTLAGATLGGADAGNYTLSSVDTDLSDITPLAITGDFTAPNKVYDGNTSSTVTARTLIGDVPADDVDLVGGTATFGNKTVGNGKTVTLAGATLGGADAGNYTLSSVDTDLSDITPLAITGDFTAPNKVYDGNTSSAVTARTLVGDVPADDVDLVGGTATFGNTTVGNGKTVTLAGATLGGADAGNYTLSSVDTDLSDITPLAITGDFTAPNKVYDGNTSSTVTARTLIGDVPADDVDLTGGTATFGNKNVANGKTVTLAGATLGGADAGNYTLSSVDTALADITPKPLTGQFTAANKVYDGNTDAGVTSRSVTGKVAGDAVDLTGGTATFGNKNVGNGKTVTLAGATLSGADAGNYTLTSVDTATANITPKALVGDFTAANKAYDGNTGASITGSSLKPGLVGGDAVTLDAGGATAAFSSAGVGTGKTVTSSGFSLAGADAGNYTLSMNTTTANITGKSVTGAFTAANKVYDGNRVATITGRSIASGVAAGDSVTLTGGTAAFDNENVGNGKPVSGSGFALGGASAANYTLTSVANTTANITPKPLTATCTAADKDYDGTTDATITGRGLVGVVGGDGVTLIGGTGEFNTPDPGTGKPVTCSGGTLAGADKDNYVLTSSGNATATIRRPPAPAPEPEVEKCLRRQIFAFVRGGAQTKRVVFFLDGKKFGDVSKRDSRNRFGIRFSRGQLGPGTHLLRATVYFTKASKRKPVKLLVLKLKPCLKVVVPKQLSLTGPAARGKCAAKAFLAFVRGDTISKVAFTLNGKRLRTVSVADGLRRYKVELDPSRLRPGKNTVGAKISFIASTKTRPMTLKKSVRACPAG